MPGLGPQQTWGDYFLGMLSPRSAEAKVVPTEPLATDLVQTVASGRTLPESQEPNPLIGGRFDPLKREIYQSVLKRAEAHPDEVSVTFGPVPSGTAAVYRDAPTAGGAVQIAPGPLRTQRGAYAQTPPTAISQQDSLAHELLHFLQYKAFRDMPKQPPAFPEVGYWRNLLGGAPGRRDMELAFVNPRQENLIQYVLGGNQALPSLQGYAAQTPFSTPPADMDAMQRLIYNAFLRQLFPEGPLRERALGGLEAR